MIRWWWKWGGRAALASGAIANLTFMVLGMAIMAYKILRALVSN